MLATWKIAYKHPQRVFWADTKLRGHVAVHLNQPTHVKCKHYFKYLWFVTISQEW